MDPVPIYNAPGAIQSTPPKPPRVDFGLVPDHPIEGEPYDATDTSFYGLFGPDVREWGFGDGSPLQNGSPVTYSYTDSGDVKVTLRVQDLNGKMCSRSKNITVNKPIPGFKEVPPQ